MKTPVPLDTSEKVRCPETLAKHGISLREYQQSLEVENKERYPKNIFTIIRQTGKPILK